MEITLKVTRSTDTYIKRGGGEFIPSALYDESSDCIRVHLMDCEYYEHYLHDSFYILKSTTIHKHTLMGVSIYNAKAILSSIGMPPRGTLNLNTILNKIAETIPHCSLSQSHLTFSSTVSALNLKVFI